MSAIESWDTPIQAAVAAATAHRQMLFFGTRGMMFRSGVANAFAALDSALANPNDKTAFLAS
jgi:hypothetical protein